MHPDLVPPCDSPCPVALADEVPPSLGATLAVWVVMAFVVVIFGGVGYRVAADVALRLWGWFYG